MENKRFNLRFDDFSLGLVLWVYLEAFLFLRKGLSAVEGLFLISLRKL